MAAFATAVSTFAAAVVAVPAAVAVGPGGVMWMVQTVGEVMIEGIDVVVPQRIVRVMQGVAVMVPQRIVRMVQRIAMVAQRIVLVQRIAAAGDGHATR